MKSVALYFPLVMFFPIAILAQTHTRCIIVDQFGYLPDSKKIAVIKDPQVGFDSLESYNPGKSYSLVNVKTNKKIYTSEISAWGNGAIDKSSGDKVWHFDFTSVKDPGKYYIQDDEKNMRSYEFIISENVYNEVLKHAVRTFYYQRAGFKKEAKYAGEAWADEASHLGDLQDKNCRSFFDKDNPETERDVSGGWYDAGDYNKYTSWTANYIVELMKAYLENPNVWTDDCNIPESGNDIPDLLDEAKWGVDHLLRLQQEDGSVLSIIGESHASPPSAAKGPSYYGPPNTSAALNAAAAFAISSKVYRMINMNDYADRLVNAAIKSWEWAEENPNVLFNNNHRDYNSIGLGAGRMEVGDYSRLMIKLEAACFLFEVTGSLKFRDFFDANYINAHLFTRNGSSPFETEDQEALLYYTTIGNGTKSIQNQILEIYHKTIVNGEDNLVAHNNQIDPYFSYIKSYNWGSNSIKCSHGNMYYDIIYYGVDTNLNPQVREAALTYIHYIHGVNPLNMTYLSNMYAFGGDNCVNEFYHSWFCNGSEKWDRVGESVYGPPPGYLTGGANPRYNWDRCCPDGCNGETNNKMCVSESISPPKNQPDQKSYKDFNTSWPLNSWEVTENSCSYQVNYIRLLSKFVNSEQ
jgi:endoglucanase